MKQARTAENPRSLLARCMAGEGHAWRDLHRAHFPAAVAFLRRMGVPGPGAEDIGQEVFLQVYRHLGRFEGRSAFRTWLYKICLRQAGRWRRQQRAARLLRLLLTRQRGPASLEAVGAPGEAEA